MEEVGYQAQSVVGIKDTAPSVKGSNQPTLVQSEDGWEGRSSDDDDFVQLTQQYVDKNMTLSEEDDLGKSKDDLEDDQPSSPVSEDSQEGMISMIELLRSFREEEDGHSPPTLTILTPTHGYVDAGHPTEGGGEISCADTQQGSGLFPYMGTTALCRVKEGSNSTMDGALFVEKMGLGYAEGSRCSQQPGNIGHVPVSPHSRGGEGEQHCVEQIQPNRLDYSDAMTTPSVEQPLSMGTDKTIPPNINNPAFSDNLTIGGGPGQPVSRPGQDTTNPPRDKQDGGMKTGRMRVVSRAGGLRGQLQCTHDDQGYCSIHGPGAREMFKGYWSIETGEDGQPKKVRRKRTWFQCDVGVNGGILKQPKLSFGGVKTTKKVGTRDNKRYLGKDDDSVGQ